MIINDKSHLESVQLWWDVKSKDWYLKLEYRCEDEAGVYKITYPKVLIGLPNHPYLKQTFGWFPGCEAQRLPSKFEDGFLVLPDKSGNFFYQETISKKTHDMTLKEIEKKLGYSVRIISKEDKR